MGYNEPWEVMEHLAIPLIYAQKGVRVARIMDNVGYCKRAVLCVNACAGMPDGEVKTIHVLVDNHLLLRNQHTALQAQLAEAKGLLKEMLPGFVVDDDLSDMLDKKAKAFLERSE